MPQVFIRFYEELNDFLPGHLPRKVTLSYTYSVKTTVKNAIEAFNIPHTEVDMVLVNGESAGFDHYLDEGDRIAVYPKFETLDISKVSKIRKAPLRNPRFIVDVNLGKLARYLRMLGFDALYKNDFADASIVKTAQNKQRIILTRDLGILKYRSVSHGYYVRSQKPAEQLSEVIARLDLINSIRPFTRCMTCNGTLKPVNREDVRWQIPHQTFRYYREFFQCRECGNIYWKGSHYKRMMEFIEGIRNR